MLQKMPASRFAKIVIFCTVLLLPLPLFFFQCSFLSSDSINMKRKKNHFNVQLASIWLITCINGYSSFLFLLCVFNLKHLTNIYYFERFSVNIFCVAKRLNDWKLDYLRELQFTLVINTRTLLTDKNKYFWLGLLEKGYSYIKRLSHEREQVVIRWSMTTFDSIFFYIYDILMSLNLEIQFKQFALKS